MIETLIITLLVVWSAIFSFKKIFPKTAMRLFSRLSDRCRAQGWHGVAKLLQPKAVVGCGGSCGTEPVANDKLAKKTEVQAVKWK